jgi:hypothetical protein
MRQLGDMTVLGDPPAKLWKALAAIAAELHPTFAAQPWIEHKDKSKESCVLTSLAVRDFLRLIGIPARVRPVCTIMQAHKDGKPVHSLGIGHPHQEKRKRFWIGHMVVQVPVPWAPVAPPGHSFLIDTTLYPAIRPQWRGAITGMLAIPTQPDDLRRHLDMKMLTAFEAIDKDGLIFELFYLDNPRNTAWKRGGDARDLTRRTAAVAAMLDQWKKGPGVSPGQDDTRRIDTPLSTERDEHLM